MTNGNGAGRIEALQRRADELKARIAAEQEKRRRRIEKENARLFSLVGEALCGAAQSPEFLLMLKQVLGSAVTDERSREFLRQKGML